MKRFWYRLGSARYVQRLYRQQDFEMMFGPAVMQRGRSKLRGFFAQLAPSQQKAALEYRGVDC